MSCLCENKRMSEDLERAKRLAKAAAKMTGETMIVYAKDGGGYGFSSEREIKASNTPIEYLTPY